MSKLCTFRGNSEEHIIFYAFGHTLDNEMILVTTQRSIKMLSNVTCVWFIITHTTRNSINMQVSLASSSLICVLVASNYLFIDP